MVAYRFHIRERGLVDARMGVQQAPNVHGLCHVIEDMFERIECFSVRRLNRATVQQHHGLFSVPRDGNKHRERARRVAWGDGEMQGRVAQCDSAAIDDIEIPVR